MLKDSGKGFKVLAQQEASAKAAARRTAHHAHFVALAGGTQCDFL